jgi:hypothetical protein
MSPGDLIIYCGKYGDRLAVFWSYIAPGKKAIIRVAGQERSVHIRSLRTIGEWLMIDDTNYTDLLLSTIGGQPVVEAIRALDAGGEPRAVYLRYQEARLSPALAEAMRLARAGGTVQSADLRALHPTTSAAALCNRLAELERTGLLVQVRKETVKGGGRRLVYAPWDASNGAEDH